MSRFLLISAASYLLGSIPFGYLLVRIFRGEDIRRSGSGNIGATNVSRKSPVLGALTLLLDAGKGFLAVQLAVSYSHAPSVALLHRVMAASALFAIVGHTFSIWLGFHGGKGVATAFGAFLRFNPQAVLVAVIIFVVVAFILRRISAGSVITAALFTLVAWFLNRFEDVWAVILIGIASLLIIIRHHQNIRRLISGNEPKFSLSRK